MDDAPMTEGVRWFRRWGWLVAVAGLVAVFGPGWWRWQRLQARAARLDGEIAALDGESRRLLAEMERLQHDPTYLERVARRKLGKARKGEVVYKVAPAS